MEFLNLEQEEIIKNGFEYLVNHNVFLTGPPGSGKTYIIKKYIKYLRFGLNIPLREIGITSTTGCSAIILDGTTIHSWSGIGLGNEDCETLIRNIRKNYQAKKNWMRVNFLIIDEISMLNSELFEKLDLIAKHMKGNDEPFGGIKLTIVGDFYQLPPVSGEYCFLSSIFNTTINYAININTIYRQKANKDYVNLLINIREGIISEEDKIILEKLHKKKINKNADILPTYLLPLNNDAEKINIINFNKLNEKISKFKSKYFVSIGEKKINLNENDLSNLDIDISKENIIKISKMLDLLIKKNVSNFNKTLELKIGTQVLLTKNIDLKAGLVNGTRGVVIGFNKINNLPKVKFNNNLQTYIQPEIWTYNISDNIELNIEQIPLIQAWAISIHKSQGQTIDCLAVDIGKNIFLSGQAYVALSRISDPEINNLIEDKEDNNGLYLINYSEKIFYINKNVKKLYNKFKII